MPRLLTGQFCFCGRRGATADVGEDGGGLARESTVTLWALA